MENKEQFGKLIIWLRERDGLSQKDLAEKLYVVPSTVCKWEKGGSVPDSEKLKLISDLFQIPYEDFLDPEKALAKLRAEPLMPESEPELESKAKHKRHRWICIATGITIVIAYIVSVIFSAHNQSDEWMILDTYEQYIDDPVFGRVYEISYIVNIYPEPEAMDEFEYDQVLPYAQRLELETDVVKVLYFDNETAWEKGDAPGCSSYLFMSNSEED